MEQGAWSKEQEECEATCEPTSPNPTNEQGILLPPCPSPLNTKTDNHEEQGDVESHHPDGDLRPDGSADCLGHHELHETLVDVKCKMYKMRKGWRTKCLPALLSIWVLVNECLSLSVDTSCGDTS